MKNDVRDKIDGALHGSLRGISPKDAPSWDSFVAYRAQRQVVAKHRSPVVRRWLSATAAVAAVLVLSLVVWRATSFSPLVMPEFIMAELPVITPPTIVENKSETKTLIELKYTAPIENKDEIAKIVPNNIQAEQPKQPSTEPKIENNAWPKSTPAPATNRTTPDWQNPDYDRVERSKQASLDRKKRAPRISTGLYAGLGYSNQSMSSGHVASMPMATMGYRVGKYEGEIDFASTEFTHSFPVSVGASLQIELVRNLNLETGLLYTYMYSESRKEPSVTYKYTRELHYIGIPIGVSYNFLSNRRIDLYATAGTMIEYAVAATATSQVLSGEGSVISSERNNIDTRGVMVSFNAAAGLNVHLTPVVGLYVEPGISTYLDNDTHPVNFRTQSPVQFSLRAGVRVKL